MDLKGTMHKFLRKHEDLRGFVRVLQTAEARFGHTFGVDAQRDDD